MVHRSKWLRGLRKRMARIQMSDFEGAVFSTNLVCPPPLHPGAHTDNVQLLQLASQARARFFAHLGYRENNVEGARMFVADQVVQYLEEAFPDQLVTIQMVVGDCAAKGFDLRYRMVDSATQHLIALGKIGAVCVDTSTRRPCAVPPVFYAKLHALAPCEVVAAVEA